MTYYSQQFKDILRAQMPFEALTARPKWEFGSAIVWFEIPFLWFFKRKRGICQLCFKHMPGKSSLSLKQCNHRYPEQTIRFTFNRTI